MEEEQENQEESQEQEQEREEMEEEEEQEEGDVSGRQLQTRWVLSDQYVSIQSDYQEQQNVKYKMTKSASFDNVSHGKYVSDHSDISRRFCLNEHLIIESFRINLHIKLSGDIA